MEVRYMISGINSEDNNLLQLLLQASKKTSSSNTSSSQSSDALSSSSTVNSDGDDFLSCLQSNFSSADSNYDSELSDNEIESFSKLSGMNPPMGPPPGMFIEDATQGTSSTSESSENNSISSLISSLDTDGDGTLSLDELTAKTNETSSDSETTTNGFTDKLSDFLGSSAGSDLASKMSNFLGQKAQEIYSNSSLLNNSSLLSSAMSHVV